MLDYRILPIVYGVHDHYDKIAPTHSFITAAKFENMKQLADYLILLDKNDTLYNEYFGGNRILKCGTHKKTKTKACAIYAPLSTTRHYQRKSIEIWPIGGKINPIVCLHHQYPDLCKTLISWLFNSVVVLSKVNVNFFCSKTVLSRKSQYIKSFITFLGRFFISLV